MKISDILKPESVVADLSARSKIDVLKELVGALAASNPRINREEFLKVLVDRERLGSTGVGDGVAMPHGKIRGYGDVMAAFGRSRAGVDFEARDGGPSHLFFLLMAPENSAGSHLKALARVSRLLQSDDLRRRLVAAADAGEIYSILLSEDGPE